MAWAYLKEELVNTPESPEIKYMKEHFKNLITFVEYVDIILAQVEDGTLVLPETHKLVWNFHNDNTRIVNSFLQKTRFESSDRFITVPKSKKEASLAENEDTPEGEQDPKTREERQRKRQEKEKKQEEKDRLKRLYVTMMVGAMFVYLNFAKNPFKHS